MKILSARYTAAAAYSAGTPVYQSAAGVATATASNTTNAQLGVLTSSVASGGECEIAYAGDVTVVTGSAANIGEWAVADSGKVVAYTNVELTGLTAGRAYTILGRFVSSASAADQLAQVELGFNAYSTETT